MSERVLPPLTEQELAHKFSEADGLIQRSDIREILAYIKDPSYDYWAGGAPASVLFPIKFMRDVISPRAHDNYGASLYQYGPAKGDDKFIDEIVRLCEFENEVIKPENVQITVGAQLGLFLIALTFFDEGDIVIVGNPTYIGAIQAFNFCGVNYVTIPLDQDGMNMDKLENTLAKLKSQDKNAKGIYVIPDF